jgi:eukaryotic-like serine/threonine-protein kinase
VRSLESSARVRLSTGGGSQPRWRRDGRELFFVSPDNRLMSVSVTSGSTFSHAAPQALFTGCGSRPLAWEYH